MSDKVQFASPRLLLLHFDLDTTKADRQDVYRAIEGMKNPAPRRLTGSVYIVPIPDVAAPFEYAFSFWKNLAVTTKGMLQPKDAFYLHVGTGQSGHLDVLYQQPSQGQLDQTPDVSVLESLFIK